MATFVIYDTVTERIARKNCADMVYPTLRGAKMVCTKLNTVVEADGSKQNTGRYVAVSSQVYADCFNPMVETVNCLTGQKCMIRKSDKGGCCDPAMESYHQM